jgi:hypothetical protein
MVQASRVRQKPIVSATGINASLSARSIEGTIVGTNDAISKLIQLARAAATCESR